MILDETQLREEIGFLKSTLRTKQKLASLKADRGLQQSSAGRGPAPLHFQTSSTKIGLLMKWINAVCDYYNLRVSKSKRVVVVVAMEGSGLKSHMLPGLMGWLHYFKLVLLCHYNSLLSSMTQCFWLFTPV